MQELIRQRPNGSGPASALQRYLFDRQVFERSNPAPAVQLIARDTFVAETAVKLEQALVEIRSLGRDMALLKSDLSELRDGAAQSARFSEFLDREHKVRATKLEELTRRFDYLKARFDAFDGNSKGDFEAFRSFEAVSRRLTELGALEREFRDVSWKLKLSAGLFAASVLVWLAVLAVA